MDSLGIPTLSQAQQSPPAILGALTTIRVHPRYSLTLLRSSQGISLKITPTLLFFLSLPLSLHTHTHIYIYTYTHTHIYIYICICIDRFRLSLYFLFVLLYFSVLLPTASASGASLASGADGARGVRSF